MFICTEVAAILYEGISKQAFLNELELTFNEQCRISGEGVMFFTKAY